MQLGFLTEAEFSSGLSSTGAAGTAEHWGRWFQALAGEFRASCVDFGGGRWWVATERLADWIGSLVNGLGDGVVSVESARLEGVDDFHVVEASHLGMILDYGRGADAPAIPIVLDRLSDDLTP